MTFIKNETPARLRDDNIPAPETTNAAAKATPGPWKIAANGLSIERGIGVYWTPIADCSQGIDAGQDIDRANARLIAAAPDLLAALEANAQWLEDAANFGSAPSKIKSGLARRAELARAAIAKAKGDL